MVLLDPFMRFPALFAILGSLGPHLEPLVLPSGAPQKRAPVQCGRERENPERQPQPFGGHRHTHKEDPFRPDKSGFWILNQVGEVCNMLVHLCVWSHYVVILFNLLFWGFISLILSAQF